ncbi:hypothetical protein R6Q59_005435 [Mikania micrantha]
MENFKEALIQFTHSNPSLFPNDAATSYSVLIEQCFPQFFADFQTPDHPPYAAMIYRALCELNKKGGSSEKSISKFIEKEYADLPWAHSTLLKHHLEKLCDRNEIRMTHKKCFLLVGAELELEKKSSRLSKKLKKGKKTSTPHKKYKKKKKCLLDIQDTNVKEQIRLRKRKQRLKSKRKSNKRLKKNAINEEIKLQLNEANLKQNNEEIKLQLNEANLKQNNEEIKLQLNEANLKQNNEEIKLQLNEANLKQNNEEIKLQLNEANLKQNNEEIKLQLNEANFKQNNDESHEQKQMYEVNMNEVGQKPHNDNSGYIELEQIQTKNPELLQPEEFTDSDLILQGNGKRVCTRSQFKTVSQKDASTASSILTDSQSHANNPKDEPAIVENLSNEQQISTSPSSEKRLVELLNSVSSKLTQLPDDEPTTGQRSTEKSTEEDKPKNKRRRSHPKPMEPEKDEVLLSPKSAAILRKSQKSAKKGKDVNKKVQPKHKRDAGLKMIRRSSRNRSS